MNPQVEEYLKNLLNVYFENIIASLNDFSLVTTLKRKNPYLLIASGLSDTDSLVDNLIDSFIQTSGETKFGQRIFEPLAIMVSGGRKSTTNGVDLEITRNTNLYLVAIKSGPNIFNASSRAKQRDYFNTAIRVYRTSNTGGLSIHPIVGYCYGRKRQSRRDCADNFEELAGERFWEFLSDGDRSLYIELVHVISLAQSAFNVKFKPQIDALKTRWIEELSSLGLTEGDSVNWTSVTKFISSNAA